MRFLFNAFLRMSTNAIESEFSESLNDLTFNSKPRINCLTMVAEDYKHIAPKEIVKCIETRLKSISPGNQLPLLYLIDSICKNVGDVYIDLFGQNIASLFCQVFDKNYEETREKLFKLRQTWVNVFSEDKLLAIDKKCHSIDPAWPITAKPSNTGKPSVSVIKPPEPKRKYLPQPNVAAAKRVKPINNNATVNTTTTTTTTAAKRTRPLPTISSQDRDYRIASAEYTRFINAANERLKSGIISRQQHQSLVQQINDAKNYDPDIFNRLCSPRSVIENHLRPPSSQPPPPSLASPLFPGVQANRMPPIAPKDDTAINDVRQLCTLVDGELRNLYYLDDNTAIVLMKAFLHDPLSELIKRTPNDLQPKQIKFEGRPTKVFIDSDRGSNEFILLEFNDQTKTFFHNEHEQRIKFGGPCREIILNGKPYLANFGGPPIEVWFNGDTQTPHSLRLDGPAPRVQLSKETRTDLWEQYIEKVQSISLNNNINNNSLSDPLKSSQTLSQSNSTSQVNPLASLLPDNCLANSLALTFPSSLPATNNLTNGLSDIENPAFSSAQPATSTSTAVRPDISALFNSLVSAGITMTMGGKIGSLLPTPVSTVPLSSSNLTSAIPSTIGNSGLPLVSSTTPIPSTTASVMSSFRSKPITSLASSAGNLNVAQLGNGGSMISSSKIEPTSVVEKPLLLEPEILKTSYPTVIADLYDGIQCTNCSLRFDSDSNDRSAYSKHLDWHFRRNKSEKLNTSKTGIVRHDWFHPLEIWIKCREAHGEDDESFPTLLESLEEKEEPEEEEIVTVPASEDEEKNRCPVCREEFELAWFEEEEEWRLKKAIIGSIDGRIYHPLCYDDYNKQQKAVLDRPKEEETELSAERMNENTLQDKSNKVTKDDDNEDNNNDNNIDGDTKPICNETGYHISPLVKAGSEETVICNVM